MKKIILIICYTMLFLFFLIIMDYPFISRIVNERNQANVAIEQQEKEDKMQIQQIKRLFQEAKIYNEQIATGVVENNNALSAKWTDEIIATIEIPKIDEILPIYHGTTEEILQKGAGVIKGTSLPIGGENTHSCISAHRGLVRKELFTRLDEMEVGDVFYIHVLGEKLAYRVNAIEEVLPTKTDSLKISKGEDLITLITCTPYGINTHRLYVHAQRFHYDVLSFQDRIEEDKNEWKEWWWVYLSIIYIVLWAHCVYRIIRNEDELLNNTFFDAIIGMRKG